MDMSFVNPDYLPKPLVQEDGGGGQGYVYAAVSRVGDAGYYSAAPSADYEPLELQGGYDLQPPQAANDLAVDTEGEAPVLEEAPVYDVATGPPVLPEDEGGYLVPQPQRPEVEVEVEDEDFGV